MKISLNDAELTALAGLPHAVICLYVMAIRPRMDFATGMVGVSPRISWHALTEWLYVEPLPGPIRSGSPGIQQVRRMAAHLVRAGIIRMRSSEIHRQLVFQCVLADRGTLIRKKPDRNPTDPYRGWHGANPTDRRRLNPTDIRGPVVLPTTTTRARAATRSIR